MAGISHLTRVVLWCVDLDALISLLPCHDDMYPLQRHGQSASAATRARRILSLQEKTAIVSYLTAVCWRLGPGVRAYQHEPYPLSTGI